MDDSERRAAELAERLRAATEDVTEWRPSVQRVRRGLRVTLRLPPTFAEGARGGIVGVLMVADRYGHISYPGSPRPDVVWLEIDEA